MPETRLRLRVRLPSDTQLADPLPEIAQRVGRPLADLVTVALLETVETNAPEDLASIRDRLAQASSPESEVRIVIPAQADIGLGEIDQLAHALGVDRAGLASIALTAWAERNAGDQADRYWRSVQERIDALPDGWSETL
jgi:hypothetical protein